MDDSLPKPDWVILGVSGGGPNGSVAVYASRRLRTAELDTSYPEPEFDPFTGCIQPSSVEPTFTVTAECAEIVVAFGADYREALNDLFKQWEPAAPDGQDPRLGSRPVALPPGV